MMSEVAEVKIWVAVACFVVLVSVVRTQVLAKNQAAGGPGQRSANANAAAKVRVSMRNVDFHLSEGMDVTVHSLDGEVAPNGGFAFPVFDDKNSFAIVVDNASLSISLASLTNNLNRWVFGSPDAPLKNLKVTAAGDKVKLSGTKGGLPFESQGTVMLAPDGMIRVHTTTIKTAHVPVKGLLSIFGVDAEDLINTSHAKGVTIDKDDLVLDPQKAWPPPILQGRLTKVQLRGQEVELTFGSPGGSPSGPAVPASLGDCVGKNFIALKGGTVSFGKVTMQDADLRIVNRDAQGPLQFSLEHYKQQLEAGYSKITPGFGLCAFVPDLNKIAKGSPKRMGTVKTPAATPVPSR